MSGPIGLRRYWYSYGLLNSDFDSFRPTTENAPTELVNFTQRYPLKSYGRPKNVVLLLTFFGCYRPPSSGPPVQPSTLNRAYASAWA